MTLKKKIGLPPTSKVVPVLMTTPVHYGRNDADFFQISLYISWWTLQIFDFCTTNVTKMCIFNIEINISDPMDHFDIHVKNHQGALLAQKNQNKQ